MKESLKRWGTSTAILLILCAYPLVHAASLESGGIPQAQIADDTQGLEADAEMSPEGVKKAIGWAVGMNSGGYGTILRTTDGGQTWERQGAPDELGNSDLVGAMAVSPREAWAAGSIGTDGLLLHTWDGGQHWYPEGDPADLAGNGLISVSAVDLYTAWAVGANGLILHTTDGGQSWKRQGAGQVPSVDLEGVYAADESHAWAVGTNETDKTYGTILRTADGEETWSRCPTPSPTRLHHPVAT